MPSIESEAGATKHLAARALNIDFANLDRKTVDHAKLLLLDQLGCILIGSILPWTKIVFRYGTGFGGHPQARVVNYATKIASQDAAFVNAVFAQGCEWDDYSTRGTGAGHAGSGTWPVALAVGECLHSSGKDIIAAAVAGYECMARVGKAVRPSSDRRGHHVHGIVSPFGGAAASGWLLRLSEHQMTMALSLAASHSAGINEFAKTGGEVKRLHSGNGARGGIQSAFLAQQGFTGPPTALEGEQGFCHAFSDEPHVEELTKTLDQYGVMESGIKVYPSVATSLSSIEAIEYLLREKGFSHQDIDRIQVGVAARAVEHGWITEQTDVASAQFSLPYGIALQAVVGSNDLDHYMDSNLWKDERITNIVKRVAFTLSPDAVGDARHGCRMTVTLKDGSKHETYVAHARGSFSKPLTANEVKTKFASLAGRVVGDRRVSELIEAVDKIETMHDVTELIDLLCLR